MGLDSSPADMMKLKGSALLEERQPDWTLAPQDVPDGPNWRGYRRLWCAHRHHSIDT